MSSINQRLSRLQSGAQRATRSNRSDEDVVSSLDTGNWDGLHLDALFRAIEPGALGVLVHGSVMLRQRLLNGNHERSPASPSTAMYWLVACGRDIPYPRGHELELWRRSLLEPIGDERRGKGRHDILLRIWEAEEGIVKRLFRKHGLGRLQDIVRLIAEAPEDHSMELLFRFTPRVDPTRWRRMVTMVQPLHQQLLGGVSLVALAEDATKFLTLDILGQEGTIPLVR